MLEYHSFDRIFKNICYFHSWYYQEEYQSTGELLLSLCYQLAARRLSVVVLKARNVPKMDITGFSGHQRPNNCLRCSITSNFRKSWKLFKHSESPSFNIEDLKSWSFICGKCCKFGQIFFLVSNCLQTSLEVYIP